MILYEKIPSLLFECALSARQENQLILPRLILKTYGFEDQFISEELNRKRFILKVFSENKKTVEDLVVAIHSLKIKGINVSIKGLKPNQWLTKWKNHWKPLSLTRKIDVVPAWYDKRYKTNKEVILLDTLMSFGTGMHETTQLISQLIENNAKRFGSFLDIGCGTGILALVALKLGAKDVTAMDISPLSTQATKDNLKVNKLKAKVILSDIGRLPSGKRYDVVAANLITDDLLKFSSEILRLVKPGGLLMVSGISLENLKRLIKGFELLPLVCCKVSKGKQWAAICYEKKMS